MRAKGSEAILPSLMRMSLLQTNVVPQGWKEWERTLRTGLVPGIGVRARGARGAAAPPNFGQLRFFGQQEKIWATPVNKDASMFILLF